MQRSSQRLLNAEQMFSSQLITFMLCLDAVHADVLTTASPGGRAGDSLCPGNGGGVVEGAGVVEEAG